MLVTLGSGELLAGSTAPLTSHPPKRPLPVLLLTALLGCLPQERREEGRGRPGGRPSRLRLASQHVVCASSPIASCSDCAVA